MAVNKMLIDASHPEETRVAVVRGNRVEEYDFESQAKRQLRGNIYLAKVTRVEPSLQAAFVEYGGNRHGFLAFSEIHPDYYQIPFADRQALLAQDEEEDEEGGEAEPRGRGRRRDGRRRRRGNRGDAAPSADLEAESGVAGDDAQGDPGEESEPQTQAAEAESDSGGQPARLDDDGESGNDGGNGRSMAAAHETDSISEPANGGDEDEGGDNAPADGDDNRPAAESRSASSRGKPRRRRTRRSGSAETAMATDAAEAAATEESGRPAADAAAAAVDTPAMESRSDEGGSLPADEPNGDAADEEHVESVGQEDAMEEVPERRRPRRAYKIQEVIKRRQIMLVQVVKEERGNKGAALTTYLSLAGRYCVLMPNSGRGGGISRKITSAADRKRLKEIAGDLEVPEGMGVILRTAGAMRTKQEIRRDYEYLMRLWENVRNLTLASNAPCLVYEEGSLIKRSIRDLYDKDTGEIIVQGEAGYREAKEFMRMLMPSHAKFVQPYLESQSLFSRHGVEAQLDRLLTPQVTLKSGGYIVINQTEALVSIDVNSGKATREHSIEDTALHTNLEAADEIARQLRLRDLAGLIVIDFIDMEENRNNRAVEKRLKEALRDDRARIQVGRISHFGLMEMSRQRIRVSVMESTMDVCPHCGGLGHVRSQSSLALHILRAVEEHLARHSRNDVTVRCPVRVALEVLNAKRADLADLEARHGVRISIAADDALLGQAFQIVKGEAATGTPIARSPVRMAEDPGALADEQAAAETAEATQETGDAPDGNADERREARTAPSPDRGGEATDERGGRRRRRRRGRRGGAWREGGRPEGNPPAADDPGAEVRSADDARSGTFAADAVPDADSGGDLHAAETQAGLSDRDSAPAEDTRPDRGRQRGSRRPGRREREPRSAPEAAETAVEPVAQVTAEREPQAEPEKTAFAGDGSSSAPPRKRRPTRRVPGAEAAAPAETAAPAAESAAPEPPSQPDDGGKKGGWWRRAGGFF
jgi:ribonuclease E